MIIDDMQQIRLTHSEKIIAEYVLQKPYILDDMAAEDLGEATFTSKSTVLRFVKKLGQPSFREFKRQISRELAEKDRIEKFRQAEPFSKGTRVADILANLPFFYDSAIKNTNMMIDQRTATKTILKMKEADAIDFYGTGITFACAQAAAYKFQTLGKDCGVFTNLNEHYIFSAAKEKKVSVILSFTGGNTVMVRSAKELKKRGFYTVGIGGVISDELLKNTDAFFEVYQKEFVTSLEFMNPYISIMYLIDVLFTGLLVSDFDREFELAMRVKEHF